MIALLLGGTGLFLAGMWMMTDGLKLAAGKALESLLRSATGAPWRGVLAGIAVTAIVQSSSAVTVATIGFVNAGLLSLAQSIWVIFGTNIGTTMTGWLVATLGFKLDIVGLALPLLGAGMVVRVAAGSRGRLSGLGQAIAGFGAFFLGIGFLQQAFGDVAVPAALSGLAETPLTGIPIFLLVGIALTILTQSSSAAMAIVLTSSAGAGLPLFLGAAAVIGTNIGTTSTAAFAALSATPPARRVAAAHIAFNCLTACAALILLYPLLHLARLLAADVSGEAAGAADIALILAVFHTLFNCLGLVLIWPLTGGLVQWLERRFVNAEERIGRPEFLDPTLRPVPQLALRGVLLETARLSSITHSLSLDCFAEPVRSPAELEVRLSGSLVLGRAIRSFIEQMNKEAMPEAVSSAIPDVIRGVQHLEEAARLAVAAVPGLQAKDDDPEIGQMRRTVIAALQATHLGPDAEPVADPDAAVNEVETSYQLLKASLLAQASRPGADLEAVERRLLQIQQMRRCAMAVWKARQRLGRWLDPLCTDVRA
ncbi:Na/Pi cotransporter family protein [Pannonibacter carbonis]|uniref:Na/Pi cotransporter family protein n=1 Tax=Pannonibacter carbonis TaxID=2067569 RepID=UPI0013002F00|nr:Na/Pi symporter [Pannonibacter carbonis]